MTEREILNRIIGPDATLADVEAAFTGDRAPEYRNYTWRARVRLRGEVISIEGNIYNGTDDIGHFTRRLYYERKFARATHEILEIERAHHRRGIALAQYRRFMPFYDRVGIRYVHMDAAGMGPFVWPTFGFDLARRSQRQRLRAILRQWGLDQLPLPEPLLAPGVVDISIPGNSEIGSQAMIELRYLAEEGGEALPMTLDLQDEAQRSILTNMGILPHEDGS
jgi:hypothetical protein